MKLLILGGTRFLGRAIVEAALADGHEVTLFNRGRSNPNLFPEVEHLRGDRDGNLEALQGRQWDAVIDTCGYVPRVVGASVALLADVVAHYTFISTISVYAEPFVAGMDESAPVGELLDESVEEITAETYGPLKVLCERVVTQGMNGRSLLVRAGLIVGPHDPTDRFTYWPVRVARGGEVLAPVSPQLPVQFIDVRDIAAWVVRATAVRLTGAYNVTGPETPTSLGEVLETCRDVIGGDAQFTWVEESFLLENGVTPFMELPLWVPTTSTGLMQVDTSKAMAQGLTFRPLASTIADTLAWHQSRSDDYQLQAGLAAEKEAALLAAWHEKLME
ncbi:MAG: SDR family oxidoreductase [Chloroflexi bacterium]|nr:MAG: SDR family oxidoreductase [Chloroflexota bacterium]